LGCATLHEQPKTIFYVLEPTYKNFICAPTNLLNYLNKPHTHFVLSKLSMKVMMKTVCSVSQQIKNAVI